MLAIELIRMVLGLGALGVGLFGVFMAFDTETFDTKGNTLLLIAGIMLLAMFNI